MDDVLLTTTTDILCVIEAFKTRFECKCCKKIFLHKDGVRKHCKKSHPEWMEENDKRGDPSTICNIVFQ